MYRTEEDMTEYATEVIAEGMDYLSDHYSHDYQYLSGELDGILKEASKRIKEEWEDRDGNESIHSLSDNIEKKKKEIIRISLLAEQILKALNISDIKEIPQALNEYINQVNNSIDNARYKNNSLEAFSYRKNAVKNLDNMLTIK